MSPEGPTHVKKDPAPVSITESSFEAQDASTQKGNWYERFAIYPSYV